VLCLSAFEAMADGGYVPTGLWEGINRVDAVATGCVLIKRSVFLHLGPAPFRIESDPTARVQSDDFLFCEDLKAAGLKVGAYWEGRPVDHFHSVALAPLAEAQLKIGGTHA